MNFVGYLGQVVQNVLGTERMGEVINYRRCFQNITFALIRFQRRGSFLHVFFSLFVLFRESIFSYGNDEVFINLDFFQSRRIFLIISNFFFYSTGVARKYVVKKIPSRIFFHYYKFMLTFIEEGKQSTLRCVV